MLKLLFNPGNYPDKINIAILLLRLVSGGMMLVHGLEKCPKLFADGTIAFADPLGVGETTSLMLTVFAEVICAILLIFGFATRLAAISLLFTMLVAALIVHGDNGFAKQELALVYSGYYLVLVISGAGKISVDDCIHKQLRPASKSIF